MPGEEQTTKEAGRREGVQRRWGGKKGGKEGRRKEGKETNKWLSYLSWEITESVSKSHLLGWSNSLDKIFLSFYPKGEALCQHSGS